MSEEKDAGTRKRRLRPKASGAGEGDTSLFLKETAVGRFGSNVPDGRAAPVSLNRLSVNRSYPAFCRQTRESMSARPVCPATFVNEATWS